MDTDNKQSAAPIAPASIVELKAELYRKQQEYAHQKSLGRNAVGKEKTSSGKKKSGFAGKNRRYVGKNRGVEKRSEADAVDRYFTDEQKLEASRLTLEAKSKLYEKMAKSGDNMEDEDGNSLYLVDFERKFIDKAMEARESRQEASGSNQKVVEDIIESLPEEINDVAVDEQWVDYTDSLGRSRRCMRKDLPKFQSLDASIKSNDSVKNDSANQTPDLMSADMHREMLREKWEKEQMDMLNNQETVHYSNVQFDEHRSHGVGYYQFSKKEEERQKELETLRQMTADTLAQREAKQKLKDKRKALLNARLEKVRMRRIAQGKPVPELKADETEPVKKELEDLPGPADLQSDGKVEDSDEPVEKKPAIREWDLGKPGLLIPMRPTKPKGWTNPREKRDEDFAPPSFYYENGRACDMSQPIKTVSSTTNSVIDNIHTHATSGVERIPLPEISGVNNIPLRGTSAADNIPLPGTSSVDDIPLPGTSSVDDIPLPGTSSVYDIPLPGTSSVYSIHHPGIGDIIKSLRNQSESV